MDGWLWFFLSFFFSLLDNHLSRFVLITLPTTLHLSPLLRLPVATYLKFHASLIKPKLPWRPMVSTADTPKCQNHKLMTATYNHDITVHPFKSHWPSPHCTTIVLLCLEPPMSILKGGRGASPTGGVVQTPNLTKSITDLTIKHKYNKIKLGSNETQI